MKVYLCLLLPLVLLSGCASDTEQDAGLSAKIEGLTPPTEDSAEASARYVIEAIRAGKPVVIWNALPNKHQEDVNDIVRSFAATMDKDMWDQVANTVRDLQTLLDEKSEFFANYQLMPGAASEGSVMKDAVPLVSNILKTVLDGAGDLEALQTFDGGKFMASTGSTLFTQLTAVNELLPPGAMDGHPIVLLANSSFETVEATAKSATLNVVGPDGRKQQVNFMKIDGKWVPLDLVQNWDQNVTNLRDKIKNLSETIKPYRKKVSDATYMVNQMMNALKGAQSQDEFNGVMNAVVGQVMMMSGMMGGPPQGGPPQGGMPPAEQPNGSSTSPQQ